MQEKRWYRLIFWIVFILIFIALITLLFQRKFIIAFSLLVLTLVGMYFGGRLFAPIYLENYIIKLLQSNGGKLEYAKVIEYFKESIPEKRKTKEFTYASVDTASCILTRLQRKNVIKIENGIVYLHPPQSDRRES